MSDGQTKSGREGNLEAPTRHALGWQKPQFYDAEALQKELDRVFDICHGCRRCFNLCNSFPTLFELIEDCADIPFALRTTGPIVPAPRTPVRWEVDDCCLAQVADIDDYP